jgi:hypothetical protein
MTCESPLLHRKQPVSFYLSPDHGLRFFSTVVLRERTDFTTQLSNLIVSRSVVKPRLLSGETIVVNRHGVLISALGAILRKICKIPNHYDGGGHLATIRLVWFTRS